MGLFAGTNGYSYKEWKGEFYPEKIKADEMLAFYATRLPTVEVNNTFYRMPRADMLQTWSERVPAKFRFVVKASRRITHIKRLRNVEEEIGFLFENLEAYVFFKHEDAAGGPVMAKAFLDLAGA